MPLERCQAEHDVNFRSTNGDGMASEAVENVFETPENRVARSRPCPVWTLFSRSLLLLVWEGVTNRTLIPEGWASDLAAFNRGTCPRLSRADAPGHLGIALSDDRPSAEAAGMVERSACD